MKIKLKEKCPRCNGRGFRFFNEINNEIVLCKLCKGHQEIDWLERIVGVKGQAIPSMLQEYIRGKFFKVRIEEPNDFEDWRFNK